jgi:AraC-like DNA-binding protein
LHRSQPGSASVQGRFKAILVERESHFLEVCRYIVLNPARVKGSATTSNWKWSSYRSTAGLASVPEFLRTDWILEQFGKNRLRAQQQYREFVREGLASRPWEKLKAQIYLGSEAFIEKHASRQKDLKEIPRAQIRVAKPSLERIFARSGKKAIAEAYEQGYRLDEIAAHLGIHYGTVSRRLKRMEQVN